MSEKMVCERCGDGLDVKLCGEDDLHDIDNPIALCLGCRKNAGSFCWVLPVADNINRSRIRNCLRCGDEGARYDDVAECDLCKPCSNELKKKVDLVVMDFVKSK